MIPGLAWDWRTGYERDEHGNAYQAMPVGDGTTIPVYFKSQDIPVGATCWRPTAHGTPCGRPAQTVDTVAGYTVCAQHAPVEPAP